MVPVFAAVAALVWLSARNSIRPEEFFEDPQRFFDAVIERLSATFAIARPPVLLDFNEQVENATWNGRALVVNMRWLGRVIHGSCETVECSAGVAIWLIAHEFAHYLHSDHLVEGTRDQELRADAIGGFALRMFRADARSVVSAFPRISPNASRVHPPFDQRQRAIVRGYNAAVRSAA